MCSDLLILFTVLSERYLRQYHQDQDNSQIMNSPPAPRPQFGTKGPDYTRQIIYCWDMHQAHEYCLFILTPYQLGAINITHLDNHICFPGGTPRLPI